ncbi:MAG: hypothetical protein VB100_06010 [Angelakisella sp.]|nr:hypothetical protein [Angelakisella sp.]
MMQDFNWEQYPGLKQKLSVLEDTPLPQSLSSQALFARMDEMEKQQKSCDELETVRRIRRWRPALSYAAAFILLVAVYYGAGYIGVANLSGRTGNAAPQMMADKSAAAYGVQSSAASAEADIAEAQMEEAADAGATEKSAENGMVADSPDMLMQAAPPTSLEEYEKAIRNTVLVVPALVADESQGVVYSAQDAMEYADLVVVGTLEEIGISHYNGGSHVPYGTASIGQLIVLKGQSPQETLYFNFGGGYVSATEYYDEAAQNSANKEGIKEGLEGKYVKVLLPVPQPDLMPGERYLLMLKEEDGVWHAAINPYGILEVTQSGAIVGPQGEDFGTIDRPNIKD